MPEKILFNLIEIEIIKQKLIESIFLIHKRKKNPEITVLMSVYNGQNWLTQSINSVLTQTFTDFEFLIIDDGSIDKSFEIMQSFKKKN